MKTTVKAAVSIIAGGALAVSIFALILQPCAGQTACLLPSLVAAWVFLGGLFFLTIDRIILPDLRARNARNRTAWLATWLAASFLTILVAPLQPELIHFLLPSRTLEILPASEVNPSSTGHVIQISYFKDGDRFDFSLLDFKYGDDWVFHDQMLQTDSPEAEPAVFHTSLLNRGRLGLITGPLGGAAIVRWGGVEQSVDLYSPEHGLTLIKLDGSGLPARPINYATYLGYFIAFFAFYILLATVLVNIKITAKRPVVPRYQAVFYALPMALVWGFFLLVFYPGILSSDSTHQWRMIMGIDPLVDWHPPIYTFLEWLLSRLWFTPATTAIAQILALSLVAGWGLAVMAQAGMPRLVGWVLSALLALSPVNSTMVITLWKDIPYAISVLALFIIFFIILTSRGEWLARKGNWLVFGLVGTAAGLFRHNGLVITSIVILSTFWVFRGHFRPLLYSTGVFIISTWLITGPLYSLAGVQRVSAVLRDTILLHHIGAHVASGTPLTDQERSYLDRLRPLKDWEYSYCRVDPLFFTPDFDRKYFAENSSMTMKTFLDLAVRDPRVDLTHTLGSSSIVWRVLRQCVVLDHFIFDQKDKIAWVEPNQIGITEASLLPSFVAKLSKLIQLSNSQRSAPWIWGPALYLYIALFCTVIYAFRLRNPSGLLFGLIPLSQSLVMIAINLASDFRYQYSVYLIGFLSISLLFLPVQTVGRKDQSLDSDQA